MPSLIEFQRNVVNRLPPELSSKDYKKSRDPALVTLIDVYNMHMEIVKQAEDELKASRVNVLGYCETIGHPRIQIGQCKICKMKRKGSVDYKKIPELEGIDLDQYRKDPTEFSTIKKDKGKKK